MAYKCQCYTHQFHWPLVLPCKLEINKLVYVEL